MSNLLHGTSHFTTQVKTDHAITQRTYHWKKSAQKIMSINYQLTRLWSGTVPILTTNLLDTGIVDTQFNKILSQTAVKAFDDYINKNTTSSLLFLNHKDDKHEKPPIGRRRRQSRGRSSKIKVADNKLSSDDGAVTTNDNFFEYQRRNGYRLGSTPYISTCNTALQLEEKYIMHAITEYLLQVGRIYDNTATQIAQDLQSLNAGLFSIDMWAAIQRGKEAYHAYHVHEGSIVSGVYYSNCPSNCAPLVLKRPSSKDDVMGRIDEAEDVVINPEEGKLILFPPWVLHGVPKVNNMDQHDTEIARVSWAFNLNGRLASMDPWGVTRP